MRRLRMVLLGVLGVLCTCPGAGGQKFQPHTIQFKGDPEYTNDELLAAAGLKKGTVLNYDEMSAHSKELMDTGAFSSLAFKFDGVDLIFSLTPSDTMVPLRLVNVPLEAGPELDARLHAKFPLYHGKVPAEGGMLDGICTGLQAMLAEEGIPVKIKPAAGQLSVADTEVRIEVTRMEGVSAALQAKAQAAADHATKLPYEGTATRTNLENVFTSLYEDEGYAAVKVGATQAGKPALKAGAIVVPFAVKVDAGKIYRIGTVQLPAGAPVEQAEVDKVLADTANPPGMRLRGVWELTTNHYRRKGYMACTVTPHASFDDAAGVANYTVAVETGPVYHMGFVRFDNVTDALKAQLMHNWEMMPGDVFDATYVDQFMLKLQARDPVLRRSLNGVSMQAKMVADPQTHDVNLVIRLEKRP